jgi:hypothetical protein
MSKADIRELMEQSALRGHGGAHGGGKSVAGQIGELEARLNDAAEAFASGVITMAQLTTINATLKPKVEELKSQSVEPDRQRVLGPLVDASGDTDQVRKVWDAMHPEGRRAVVALLLDVFVKPLGRRTAIFDPSGVHITWRTG